MKWNNQHPDGEELAGFCSGRWRAQPQEPLHRKPVFPPQSHTTSHRGWNLSPVRARIFAPLPQEVSGDALFPSPTHFLVWGKDGMEGSEQKEQDTAFPDKSNQILHCQVSNWSLFLFKSPELPFSFLFSSFPISTSTYCDIPSPNSLNMAAQQMNYLRLASGKNKLNVSCVLTYKRGLLASLNLQFYVPNWKPQK